MANLYDQIPVPVLHSDQEGALDAHLELDRETPQTTTVDAFCRGVLHSVEYRDSLMRRIEDDRLSPQIEMMLYHFAYGKPVEKLEVRDTTVQIENLTAEECEQRALFLVEYARNLRTVESNDENALPGARPPTIN